MARPFRARRFPATTHVDARWAEPLCIGTSGLLPISATPIVDRIKSTAIKVGAGVGVRSDSLDGLPGQSVGSMRRLRSTVRVGLINAVVLVDVPRLAGVLPAALADCIAVAMLS